VKLTDQETQQVFYDKLTFIYLEMPKFNKTVDELESRFEKWLYVIRNLNRLDRVPDALQERVFEQLFETAEIARFTPEQVRSYEDSLKHYRDLKNSLDTAREEGREEGREEIARKMRAADLPVTTIADLTGLTESRIKDL
jgi:predicted transposase/invertase (TIGR01784 family)